MQAASWGEEGETVREREGGRWGGRDREGDRQVDRTAREIQTDTDREETG